MNPLGRLFPARVDNAFAGHPLAYWFLAPPLILKLLMGFNVAGLNPWISSRHILKSADGVPVDTYPPELATLVVFLFASWGYGLLILAALCLVAVVRYRALLPLMILALLAEQAGRMVLSARYFTAPVAEGGVSPSALINWGLAAFLAIAFILSLAPRKTTG